MGKGGRGAAVKHLLHVNRRCDLELTGGHRENDHFRDGGAHLVSGFRIIDSCRAHPGVILGRGFLLSALGQALREALLA